MFTTNQNFKFGGCPQTVKPMLDVCPKLRRKLNKARAKRSVKGALRKVKCKDPLLIEGMIQGLMRNVLPAKSVKRRRSAKKVKKMVKSVKRKRSVKKVKNSVKRRRSAKKVKKMVKSVKRRRSAKKVKKMVKSAKRRRSVKKVKKSVKRKRSVTKK